MAFFHPRSEDRQTDKGKKGLWERYLYGLLEGTLQAADDLDEMRKIPPEVLASMLNEKEIGSLRKESYNKVIAIYIRSSSERFFSNTELKKLMVFTQSLRPELKRQFLSSAVKKIPTETVPIEKALGKVSIDRVIELLSIVNEHKIEVPEALKNLIDKFTKIDGRGDLVHSILGDTPVLDDILLSPDIITLLGKGDFEAFVTEK